MSDPNAGTGIGFTASTRVHEVIASIGRTEDVRFSPNARRLAVAGFSGNRIAVFDVEIVHSASGKQVAIAGGVEVSSPSLARPHGLDFIDDSTLIVANRDGGVVIFTLPPGTEEIRTCQLMPIQTLPGDRAGIVRTPGSVAVMKKEHGFCEALVCNNYVHTVTRHILDVSAACAVRGSELVLRKWLDIPDGLSISTDHQWLAVSNHDHHSVLLYEYGPSTNPQVDPDGILRGVYYPHGVRFTRDGTRILVADAGAPFVRIYARPDAGSWRGVHEPIAMLRVIDEPLFLRGRKNPQEGGPKGIDIDSGSRVLVLTTELLPLAFFDLAATFEQDSAGTARRDCGAAAGGSEEATGSRMLHRLSERTRRQEAAAAVDHELFLFEESRKMKVRIAELKASLDCIAHMKSSPLVGPALVTKSFASIDDQFQQQPFRRAWPEPTEKLTISPRTCGQCQACCAGWLSAEIRGHQMGKGVPCRFLKPDGCGIYESRPELCRSFVCGWLKPGSPFPDEWRPDKAGFIIREGLWEGRTCWLLQYAGKEPSEEAMEAMRQHTISTGEPHIIKKKYSWLCYGKPEFQQAMLRLSKEIMGEMELKKTLFFW